MESANICKNTSSGCKPTRFNVNDNSFLTEIDQRRTSEQKFSHCLDKCQQTQSNSYCDNQDCLSLCNNLNLKTTDGLIRYRERDNSELSDRHYESLVNRITSLPENSPLMKKILDPLKKYSNLQDNTDKEEELKQKIENLNKASVILTNLSDTNIEVSKDMPQKMMIHLENLLRKKGN